jgi:hypothetical protein
MTRIALFLFSAFTALSLSSCLDVVNLDVPEGKPLLVVEGQITDQAAPPTVKLSMTQAYFNDATPPAVSGAAISLVDDLGGHDVLRETSPGLYVGSGSLRGRTGGHYTLTIETNGQTYRAETEIRRTPEIDSLSLVHKDEQLGYDEGMYALYNGPEPAGVGDYYHFKVYKNGKLLNDPGDLLVVDDNFVDGRYIHGFELNRKPLVTGDKIRVELNSISSDYYGYLFHDLYTQVNNIGLFATTTANIRTNVKNTQLNSDKSVVGYFAGYTVRTDSVTVR